MKLLSMLLIFSLYFNYHQYKKSKQLFDRIENLELTQLSLNEKIQIAKNNTIEDSIPSKVSSIAKINPVDNELKDISNDLEKEFADLPLELTHFDVNEVIEEFENAGKNYFVNNAMLGEGIYQKYLQIKEEHNKELDRYSKKYEKLMNDAGEGFFIPSHDMNIEHSKIMESTLNKLKLSLGEESFNKYMKFVHRFNQELVRRSPNGAPQLIMSF